MEIKGPDRLSRSKKSKHNQLSSIQGSKLTMVNAIKILWKVWDTPDYYQTKSEQNNI
jgi:hypothetical protein